ncbi:MAG: geranylgeranylglyceryl/heptaprenylglyceryl phosphate synthase [Bacteroidetes bacterium]|nr:MAG: geranylgeranylglyceryl/heptaprenylglyceryl phosphate synthase [Bacteroidota bacterium]
MLIRVYDSLVQKHQAGQKMLAVLIDPDHVENLEESVRRCNASGVDLIFLGGSLITSGSIDETIRQIKSLTDIPVLLFPGDELQISSEADALLLLSLISGRNADLLIGKHVIAAPYLKKSGLELIATGYMLIDGGKITTASYISGSVPIPADKPEIAMCTALAGEMLGLKLMYMDAGSGAANPVSEAMIQAVRKAVDTPIVVGGGIRSTAQAVAAWNAGADIVVVGNAIEDDNSLISDLMNTLQALQSI